MPIEILSGADATIFLKGYAPRKAWNFLRESFHFATDKPTRMAIDPYAQYNPTSVVGFIENNYDLVKKSKQLVGTIGNDMLLLQLFPRKGELCMDERRQETLYPYGVFAPADTVIKLDPRDDGTVIVIERRNYGEQLNNCFERAAKIALGLKQVAARDLQQMLSCYRKLEGGVIPPSPTFFKWGSRTVTGYGNTKWRVRRRDDLCGIIPDPDIEGTIAPNLQIQ